MNDPKAAQEAASKAAAVKLAANKKAADDKLAADKKLAAEEEAAAALAAINKDAEKKSKAEPPITVPELPKDAILEQPKEYVTYEGGEKFVTKTGEDPTKSKKKISK